MTTTTTTHKPETAEQLETVLDKVRDDPGPADDERSRILTLQIEIAKLAALERIAATLGDLDRLLEIELKREAAGVVVDRILEATSKASGFSVETLAGQPGPLTRGEAIEGLVGPAAKILEHVRRRGLDPARATVQLEQSPADGGWFLKISGPRFDDGGDF